LRFEAIATVYGWARQGGQATRLPLPMMALRASAAQPAQFVFDRGQLGGPAGLQAWVVSASQGERLDVQQRVVAQAQAQCGVQLQPLQTVVEKRATFAAPRRWCVRPCTLPWSGRRRLRAWPARHAGGCGA
jgi:hypothetical protein